MIRNIENMTFQLASLDESVGDWAPTDSAAMRRFQVVVYMPGFNSHLRFA